LGRNILGAIDEGKASGHAEGFWGGVGEAGCSVPLNARVVA
jgi:hypothetical protein